jgi:hypothetical protein
MTGHVRHRHEREALTDVWWSERANAFRAALVTDQPRDVCRDCALYRGVFSAGELRDRGVWCLEAGRMLDP